MKVQSFLPDFITLKCWRNTVSNEGAVRGLHCRKIHYDRQAKKRAIAVRDSEVEDAKSPDQRPTDQP